MLAPETGKARLPTVDRRTGGTARQWTAEDRNCCLDVMMARQVKHDCRYRGTVPLQIRWTAVDVVEHVVIDRQGTSGTNAGPGLYETISQENKINSKMVDDLTIALVPMETSLVEN